MNRGRSRPARIAVVTGATSGIGAATARQLASGGFGLVVTGRRTERLDHLVGELAAGGADAVGLPGDAADVDLVRRLFAAAERRWDQSPDAVVLSAGRGLPGTLLASDDERWRDVFELNYLATARQLRACAARFAGLAREQSARSARDIVVIGSAIGRQVSPYNPVYGSTKFAIHSLVEALRQEVCALGIRTTLIEPGFVRSGFQAAADYDEEWFRSVEAECGPLLEPEDVARVIAFVVGQPPHVHVDDVRIRPTRQRT